MQRHAQGRGDGIAKKLATGVGARPKKIGQRIMIYGPKGDGTYVVEFKNGLGFAE